MEFSIGYYIGLPIQCEIIFLTLCGLCFTFTDRSSVMDLNTNLQEIWSTQFPSEKFSPFAQSAIKILIASVVVIKTFTLHLYLAFYIVMIWPALFGEKAGLLLPWLIVSGIKNILIQMVSFCIGLFVCVVTGGFRPTCVDFFVKQLFRLVPSCYMWFTVVRYYRILCAPTQVDQVLNDRESKLHLEMALRRRRVRSLLIGQCSIDDCLSKDDNSSEASCCDAFQNEEMKCISVMAPESCESLLSNRIVQFIKVSRSLDTFLTLMSLRSVTGSSISDACKVSPPDTNNKSLTLAERAKRLLKLTDSEIQLAKDNKARRDKLNSLSNKADLCVQIAHLCKKEISPDIGCKSKSYPCGTVKRRMNTVKRTIETELKTVNMESSTGSIVEVNFWNSRPDTVCRSSPKAIANKIVPKQNSQFACPIITTINIPKLNNIYLTKYKQNSDQFLFSHPYSELNVTDILQLVPKSCDRIICPTRDDLPSVSINASFKSANVKTSRHVACQVSTLSKTFLDQYSTPLTSVMNTTASSVTTLALQSKSRNTFNSLIQLLNNSEMEFDTSISSAEPLTISDFSDSTTDSWDSFESVTKEPSEFDVEITAYLKGLIWSLGEQRESQRLTAVNQRKNTPKDDTKSADIVHKVGNGRKYRMFRFVKTVPLKIVHSDRTLNYSNLVLKG